MKLNRNLFIHYTEVVLSKIAKHHKLPIIFGDQIRNLVIQVALEGSTTEQLDKKTLVRCVSICRDFINNPTLFINAYNRSNEIKLLKLVEKL